MVEDDDAVDIMEALDVLVVLEVQVAVDMVELVDNDALEIHQIDVMVENDDVVEVQIIVMVVVDDEVVVDDDYTEMVVIDEMVVIIELHKCIDENDEKVEILDALVDDEMVVKSETHIHEAVEKVVIDEIDGLDEIDHEQMTEREMHHELVENEYYVVELVDEWIEVLIDELVVMQLQMFTDSI